MDSMRQCPTSSKNSSTDFLNTGDPGGLLQTFVKNDSKIADLRSNIIIKFPKVKTFFVYKQIDKSNTLKLQQKQLYRLWLTIGVSDKLHTYSLKPIWK